MCGVGSRTSTRIATAHMLWLTSSADDHEQDSSCEDLVDHRDRHDRPKRKAVNKSVVSLDLGREDCSHWRLAVHYVVVNLPW